MSDDPYLQGTFDWYDNGKEIILAHGHTQRVAALRILDGPWSHERQLHRARFIARACNCHAELLAGCEMGQRDVDGGVYQDGPSLLRDVAELVEELEACGDWAEALRAKANAEEAAIAKCEKGAT